MNISEQVKELKELARKIKRMGTTEELKSYKVIVEAADTIEALSAKLVAVNVSGWIACEDRLPKDGQKVLATHEGGLKPERQVIEHIFKDGQFTLNWDMDTEIGSPTFGQRYMGKVIAWMPKPEPYHP